MIKIPQWKEDFYRTKTRGYWLDINRKEEECEFHSQCSELDSEAVTQRCSLEKVFWKYAANLLENTLEEVWFQEGCFATFMKSHFGMDVLL